VKWRGKLTHVLSGETRYFRGLAGLMSHLRSMSAAHTDAPIDAPAEEMGEHEIR
jgi:hypothetical protein